MCDHRKFRPAFASAQSDQSLRWALYGWSMQAENQTLIRLCGYAGGSESSLYVHSNWCLVLARLCRELIQRFLTLGHETSEQCKMLS